MHKIALKEKAKLAETRHSVAVVKSDAVKADHEAENDAERAHKSVLKAKTEL